MALGLFCGLISIFAWGFLPLFWVRLSHVPAVLVLAFRIITALSVAIPYLIKNKTLLKKTFKNHPIEWVYLMLSTSLIGFNWYLFVVCMLSKRILESSLAYFITPLMAVFIGIIFLGEKVNRVQKVALALATVAVLVLCMRLQIPPFLALLLASTFGCYGYFKKKSHLKGVLSVSLEVFLLSFVMLPVAASQPLHFDTWTWVLLLLSGPLTIIPLILYARSLEDTDYTLIGFLQYVAPVLQFLTALYIFNEPFLPVQKFSFCLIWIALLIFTVDLAASAKRRLKARPSVRN